MSLQLQSETEIDSNGDGSVVYVGEWDECLAMLSYFRATINEGAYSIVAFQPPVVLDAPPDRYTSETATEASYDWSADETAIRADDLLVSLSARIRSQPGGMGTLTIALTSADQLRKKVRESLPETTATGEQTYTFGVTEIPHSIIEDQSTDIQDHIAQWLSAPTVLKSRFLYLNASTGENASLTSTEIAFARKILIGEDTVYTYLPNVTLNISRQASAPSGLPEIGAATGPSAGAVTINLPSGSSYAWRVISSGFWTNPDGTFSGQVQWVSEEA